MIITELKAVSNDRFLVGFDDGSELRVPLSVVADLSLHTSLELSDEEYHALLDAAALANAKARALRIIGARPLSEKELRDKLTEKGESPENAEECVRWLREMRLLNDAEYAGMVARHYAAKGYGAARVKNELFRRGVPKEYWDEALEELGENEEKIDRLLRSRLKGDWDKADLKRATDFLYRRGFGWEEIRGAVERLHCEEF